MSLRLYFDHNVPRAVARGLRRRSVDVLLAQDDGRDRTADEQLLERATELGRVVFTQDSDFLAIASRWNAAGRHFPGILFTHPFRATIGQLVIDLQLVAELMPPEELRNNVLYLPL